MGIRNKLAQYRAYKAGVKHCTFDPEGQGVVRIHLVPPRFNLFRNNSSLLILNGYYILPIGYSWSILISEFLDRVNEYSSRELSAEDVDSIYARTLDAVMSIFSVDRDSLRRDLDIILDVIFDVAHGVERQEIQPFSIRSYRRRMTAPHRMDIAISSMTKCDGSWKCNQRCAFCYAADQPLASVNELSTEQWKAVIDKLRRAGVPMLTFTGGEPTQREDLCELIEYASWFITRLNTNGALLTEELCAGLRKASLDSVQITLYSSDRDIHNKLVGADNFDATVQGIRNAISAGLDVSVNTPLCLANRDYISTLTMLSEIGVRYVTVSGLILSGAATDKAEKYDLTQQELEIVVSSACNYCKGHSMELDFTSPGLIDPAFLRSLGLRTPICGAALSNMSIGPDGTVVPCQSWLREDSGLGNILTDSWRDIWDNKLCRRLRGMSEAEAAFCPFRSGNGGVK